jgi:hypothetical protein
VANIFQLFLNFPDFIFAQKIAGFKDFAHCQNPLDSSLLLFQIIVNISYSIQSMNVLVC